MCAFVSEHLDHYVCLRGSPPLRPRSPSIPNPNPSPLNPPPLTPPGAAKKRRIDPGARAEARGPGDAVRAVVDADQDDVQVGQQEPWLVRRLLWHSLT